MAYIETIANAKYFIYIENQFFISGVAGGSVNNGIARALIERVKYAHKKQQKFKIIVLMPLLPAFQGEDPANMSGSQKVQLH